MQLLPIAIEAGGMIGGALLGNRTSKEKNSPAQQGVLDTATQAQKAGIEGGTGLLNQGQSATQAPMNYWASILSGNKAGITSALGPELFDIQQGYQRAGQTSAALNPRGGPSASFLGELPWQQAHDVSSLMQKARPGAASSLFQGGNNLLSQGANLINMSTSAGRTIMDSEQDRKRIERERGTAIGKGIFDLIQKYGPGIADMLMKGGSKGSGTSTGGILGEYP